MATPPIKATTISSDPRKTPVVKDVYHESTVEVSNDIRQPESPAKKAATQYLTNTNLSSADVIPEVTSGISNDSDGLTFDFSEGKKRIERSFGVGGGTNGLSSKNKRDIGNALESTTGTKDSKLAFNDVTRLISNSKDGLTVSSLVGAINSLSGRSDLFKMYDLEAEAAFVKGISDTIIELRIPELLDAVIDNLNDAKLKNEMLEEMAIRSSRRGDAELTEHFARKMGRGRSYAVRSVLITNLMKSYSIPSKNTRSYAELGNSLLNFFLWMDVNWDKDKYDNSLVNLEYYSYGNAAVRSVLLTTAVADNAAAGAMVVVEKPMVTAGRMFPAMLDWAI